MLNTYEQLTNLGEITTHPEQLATGWARVERYLVNHCSTHADIAEYITVCKAMRNACDQMLVTPKGTHYLVLVKDNQMINIKPVLQVIDQYDGQYRFVQMLRGIKEMMHKAITPNSLADFTSAISTLDDWEFLVSNFDY